LVLLLCLANICNLGADVSARAAASQLVAGGTVATYALLFGAVSLLLQIYVPYHKYARYLKWLTWSLFAYVVTAFVVHIPWAHALKATVIPSISFKPDYLMALIAVLGTTISPYLFFWQTSQEVEDVRVNAHESPLKKKPLQAFKQFRRIAFDTRVGMAFSNIVAFFIILTTAATLHSADPGAAITSAPQPMPRKACNLSPAISRFCCLPWESWGPDCWRFPFWPAPPPTPFRKCSGGGQAWKASRARRATFTQ